MAMALPYLCINAQHNIKGTVTDQDHQPLAAALIYIPELNKTTVADANGVYSFANIPDGKIKLQFSFIGHSNHIQPIVMSGEDVTLNVSLATSAIETEEIVVSGGYHSSQHENAVKIDVLRLNEHSMVSPNFAQRLTKIPGVDMISKGSGVSKPVIRGLSMNDILVLNNGVRFENYQYSSHHPLGIDEFGIEDVEVIKGPASLLYGSDAIGGVVNFIKEKPAPAHQVNGDYNLQLHSNSQGVVQNVGVKAASEKLFGSIRIGHKSHADYLQGGGDFVPNSRFNEQSIKTNLGYTGKVGTLQLFYDFNRQNLGLVEEEAVEAIASRGRKNDIFYQQLNTHLLSLQNRLYLGKSKLDVNASYQNTELIHFGEPDEYELQMNLGTLTYESRLYLPSDTRSEYIIGFQGINQVNTNTHDRETILLPDANTDGYGVFGLLQRTFFDNLKLQTGVRYDSKTIATSEVGQATDLSSWRPAIDMQKSSFSGSLGATLALSHQWLMRANIASAYRTPNLAELTSNGPHEARFEVGNMTLTPEQSSEADLSMHLHFDNVTVDIAGFYNHINDYIYITPTGTDSDDGLPIYQYRQNNANLYGGEAGLHIHPSIMEWLHFETTFSTVTAKQDNGEYLPFIPANKLNVELRAEKARLAFLHNCFVAARTHSASKQHHAAPDETPTNGYTLLDVNIGASLKAGNQSIVLGMGVANVFDKQYIDHLSTLKEVNLNNAGRNMVFSITYAF